MRKVIIAGGRLFGDVEGLFDVMSHLFGSKPDVEVVHGGAEGADLLGAKWGSAYGLAITPFPADWNKHGRKAGILRNLEMAEYSEVLVAFWDGHSRGTKHMIDTAIRAGLETHVYRYESS
jgi:hypothetical protein